MCRAFYIHNFMSPSTSEHECYCTQVTVEETEAQRGADTQLAQGLPGQGEPSRQPHILPTPNAMLHGWASGPWRADPASLQEDQERKRGGSGEAGSPAVTPWERPGRGSQTRAKGWQRSLEQLWSSAVWKTSDFVVLVHNDNKSQLPHSVDSHRPPPELGEQAWGGGSGRSDFHPGAEMAGSLGRGQGRG